MTVAASTPIELIQGVYATLDEHLEVGRRRMGGPLTLAEKILVNHLDDPAKRMALWRNAVVTFFSTGIRCSKESNTPLFH